MDFMLLCGEFIFCHLHTSKCLSLLEVLQVLAYNAYIQKPSFYFFLLSVMYVKAKSYEHNLFRIKEALVEGILIDIMFF